ncbi:hypothetical protein HNP84_001946 [Thermocatellispora tengchongensis]|uniref:Secreted protein n=1 Tax=Thermocatellispora tengchongensis TaxID=1073253 RepID=A0A840P426_9ACTN|nr:hypothetical protein [Thermocatellispora tengchongensis]MBB5132230.1 hypothetical protein [Thermocatellispora tengchongensis]
MRHIIRGLVAAAVAGGVLAVAPAASAVVDPVAAVECLTASVGEVTHLVDPAQPGVPTELPAVHCLAP